MRSALLEALAGFITAAFAFAAALAWNNVILVFFQQVFGTATGLAQLLTYAILVTVVAVLATYWVGKALQRARESEQASEERMRKVS
jgi:membrane protein implicated in regulation of membrane protease activity